MMAAKWLDLSGKGIAGFRISSVSQWACGVRSFLVLCYFALEALLIYSLVWAFKRFTSYARTLNQALGMTLDWSSSKQKNTTSFITNKVSGKCLTDHIFPVLCFSLFLCFLSLSANFLLFVPTKVTELGYSKFYAADKKKSCASLRRKSLWIPGAFKRTQLTFRTVLSKTVCLFQWAEKLGRLFIALWKEQCPFLTKKFLSDLTYFSCRPALFPKSLLTAS